MCINRCLPGDQDYPKGLMTITKYPEELFYKGNIDIINGSTCVAIVGSREVSDVGIKKAYEYGQIAAEKGFVVVNGLAIGCDTHAIRGALSVGGKCVAVLPCGLDYIYPKTNERLACEVVKAGGCIISEYEEGIKPTKYSFVHRDRLQSGISAGVVVVETEIKGGTMHTVDFARKQNRRLACYYSKASQMKSGNKEIAKRGVVDLVEDKESFVDFLMKIKEVTFVKYDQLALF